MSRIMSGRMIKNENIFISGGCGFIGCKFAEMLADNNKIILYDINTKKNSYNYSSISKHKNVTVIEGDITEPEMVRNAIKDATIIVHTAAIVGVKKVIEQPRLTLEVNFIGTQNILKSIQNYKKIKRFVYFSTSEIFGGYVFRAEEEDNTIIGTCNDARWSYAISKIAGEHLVQAYNREFGLKTVIIRPFNIFGPGRFGEHALKIFIEQALRGDDITILQDGSQVRSWCYIDDFTQGVYNSIIYEDAIGKSFNLGNPINTITIYELAKMIKRLLGSKSKIIFIDATYSDIDLRIPSITYAKKVIRFNPCVELEEGILKTSQWYKQFVK
ncbi:MAG: NAD-dependent epimerase/dehydratase family protein [Candidatus Hydrogenedentota bacterium]